MISSPHRIRIHTGRWILALLVVLGQASCDKPCDRLEERLEACTRQAPERGLHDAPGVKDAIRTGCRRAEPSRVKRCLDLRDCRQLLDCAAKALKAPKHRF